MAVVTVPSYQTENDKVYPLAVQILTLWVNVDPVMVAVSANRAEWAPLGSVKDWAPERVGTVETFCDQKDKDPPPNSNPPLTTAWVAVQAQAEVVLQLIRSGHGKYHNGTYEVVVVTVVTVAVEPESVVAEVTVAVQDPGPVTVTREVVTEPP
jgi:hypothetical protein